MDKFEGVPDTLFIPLTARIYVSKRFPEYFYDSKALELESLLPEKNTIAEKSNEYSMIASAARYYNMDQMVRDFISKHGKCNIVNLGCGLETSYFRIGNRDAVFYEVDLPEVIEGRRKVLGDSENEKLIAGNLFDLKWTEEIKDRSLPTLMVVAGVFEYFHEEEILDFIKNVRKYFDKLFLIFDATNSTGIKYTIKYVKKTGNQSAMMYFYVDNADEFARKCNCRLVEFRPFYRDARKMIGRKTGLYTRIAMKVCDDTGRANIVYLDLS